MLLNNGDIKFKDFRYFQWQMDYLKDFLFKDILYKDEFLDEYYCHRERRSN